MSSNQKHIEVIEQMLATSQKYEGDRPGTTSAALIAAKEALEREGQMEARLRSFMSQAFDVDKMRTDPSTAQYFIGVDDFTGFCAVIDSEILETYDGR